MLSRDSRSSEKFIHGIKVLMAKNYIDNLSEETRKGMQEKAEQGIWPTKTPLGYRNVAGPDGKRVIEPDLEVAPIIARLFEWYAPGGISLKDAARMAADAGLKYRRSGSLVPISTVHKILRNRLYMGEFEWNGRLYQGRHVPLVARSYGNVSKASSMADTRRNIVARSTISHSQVSSRAVTVGARWLERSRKGATSITTAPATRGNALSPTYARRSWKIVSPRYSVASPSTKRFCSGRRMRFASVMLTRRGSTKRQWRAIKRNMIVCKAEFMPCTSTS